MLYLLNISSTASSTYYFDCVFLLAGIQLKESSCNVYCEAVGEGIYRQLVAQDGTRCRTNSLDVCIAGCSVLDRCGVCNGDGTTCAAKTGIHSVQHLGKRSLVYTLVLA